ncbi:hypothetical protein N9K77_01740 [bacterium]|nr:hypothetical protein [bacterium]
MLDITSLWSKDLSSLVDEYKNLIGASNYKDGATPKVKNFDT